MDSVWRGLGTSFTARALTNGGTSRAVPLKPQQHSPPLFLQQISVEFLLCSDTIQMPGIQGPTKQSLSRGEILS